MTATTFTHRCARGHRCAHADDGLGTAIEAPEGLCRACERAVEHHLRDLPRLYIALEAIIGDHGGSSAGEHVGGTREPTIPPRVDVLVYQQHLDVTAAQWAAPVARRVRSPWDGAAVARLRPGPRLVCASTVLWRNLSALLALPSAEFRMPTPYGAVSTRRSGLEGALELFTLSETAWRRVTGGPGHDRLPVPCPHCEGALIRRNGSDQVDCVNCDARWPESDYRHLCLVLAEDLREGA